LVAKHHDRRLKDVEKVAHATRAGNVRGEKPSAA
jgi:hypothetical protein